MTARNRSYCFVGIGMILHIFLILLSDYPVAGLGIASNRLEALVRLFAVPAAPAAVSLLIIDSFSRKKNGSVLLTHVFIIQTVLVLIQLIYHLYATKITFFVCVFMALASAGNAVLAAGNFRKKLFGTVGGKQMLCISCYIPLIYEVSRNIQLLKSSQFLSSLLYIVAYVLIVLGCTNIIRLTRFGKASGKVINTEKISEKKSA